MRNKKLKLPSVAKKKVYLNSFLTKGNLASDESISDFGDVSLSYNFDVSDGTLKPGIGVGEYKPFSQTLKFDGDVFPVKIYYYNRYENSLKESQDRLIVYASDKKLYYIILNVSDSFVPVSEEVFESAPICINYNFSGDDVLILSFEQEGLYILNGTTLTSVESAPKITSMCIHSERLFATTNEDSSLWFSDDFNPTNWSVSLDEAGYIELPDERGKLLKVISFLDYVYVFRSYGISRVYAFGDQSDFSVDNLYNNLGKVYANTVTECGGYIIFLTSSGLYRFNGIDAVKILPFYDKFLNGVDNEDAKGVFFNGKLYLNLNMRFTKNKVERVVLVYDIELKVPYIAKDLKIDDLELVLGEDYKIYAISSGLISTVNNSGKRFSRSLKKTWESGKTNFNIDTENKYLDKIKLSTNCDLILYVICDDKVYIYNVDSGENEVKLKLKGSEFKFKIITYNKEPKIFKPTFFFSYLKENLW